MAGNLDKLHEKNIIMILQFVKNKKAVYLTCRRLNKLCLQIDNITKDIELNISSNETLKKLVKSIINSKRFIISVVIGKVCERALLTSVLEKIGFDVRTSTIMQCSFNDLSFYLSLLPNIKTLNLENIVCDYWSQTESFSLKKITKLSIKLCDEFRMREILRDFPENVLEKFEFRGDIYRMEEFIMKQRNLKVLKLRSTDIDFDLINFQILKLSSFNTDVCGNLITFLESQPQLKNLTLFDLKIDDDTFRCVTQLKLLSNLKMIIEGVSRFAIRGLSELTNLESLELMNIDKKEYKGEITELSQMKFDKLTVLIINFPYQNVPSSDFIDIAANFKNLSTIDITLKVVTNDHIQPLITTVESLFVKIGSDYDDEYSDDEYSDNKYCDEEYYEEIFSIHQKNLHLKDLSILGMQLKTEDLTLIIKNFPNLMSLTLEIDRSVFDEHVEQLLIGMPKLQILELRRCCRLTIKIVDIIKKHGKHLNKISMSGIENFPKLQFDKAFRDYPQDIDCSYF